MKRTVPAEYQGLWRRTGIWRSNGSSDLTTQVWWFQSSSFHIDLRIPADRPMVAAAADLAQLPAEQLQRFAAQTGFAGLTVVDGERCAWHPEIAFPYVSSEADAGIMRFDSPDQLHETGLDNSYEEDWLRVPTGAMRGIRLIDVGSGAIAYLLISERWMAWACGRPVDAFKPLRPEQSSEFSIFEKRDDQWLSVASNLPWRNAAPCPAEDFDHSLIQRWQTDDLVNIPYADIQQWRIQSIADFTS